MIELIYFLDTQKEKTAYQVIQFNPGEPWQIVEGDELIGKMEKRLGFWNLLYYGDIPEGMLTGISELIENQHYNKLPTKIKEHWHEYVYEVVAQSDELYLVICKPDISLDSFEKLFRAYIPELVKDEWQVKFRVYDAEMSQDFDVLVN